MGIQIWIETGTWSLFIHLLLSTYTSIQFMKNMLTPIVNELELQKFEYL
jgi:hypothetical protein